MQFTVPQFIDVEDKIFGPISVRQFLTFLIGAVLVFADYQIVYKMILPNFWIFAVTAIFTLMVTGTFAFFKVNGRPFHYFLLNLLVTLQKPRLRVWNKKVKSADLVSFDEDIEIIEALPIKKPLTMSKLTEISLIVDTGGAYQEGLNEEADKPSTEKNATGAEDIFS